MSQTRTNAGAKGSRRGGKPVGRTVVPVQAPVPGGPQGATLAVPDVASVGSRLAGWFSGSPGKLRIAAAVGVVACLVLALGGAAAMQLRASALQDARSHAAQVVRVQKAGADLVRADAAVTNGFLAGGAEPVALTAEYDAAIGRASRLLVDAAAAEPGDTVRLAQANQLLADYSRQIAHARDYNRLNQPLGSGYLVLGSQTVLRDQLLPLLAEVVENDAAQVDDAYGRAGEAVAFLILSAGVGAIGLVLVQVWLARRTHRWLNVGLVAASALVTVGIIGSVVVVGSTGSTADEVRSTSYAATSALAKARAAAYSAKGLESLTLVKQGGGAAYEKAWQADQSTIAAQLDAAAKARVDVSAARAALAQWVVTHTEIRRLDDGGSWPTAVAAATVDTASAASRNLSSNTDFAALVAALDPALDAQSTAVSDRLSTTWTPLQVLGWGLLVLGVLAAVASVGGISRRLGEYR